MPDIYGLAREVSPVESAESKGVKLTYDDGVAHITIDRPPVKPLTLDTLIQLSSVFRGLEDRTEPMVVIIRGGGKKAFAAGADIREIHRLTSETGRNLSKRGHEISSQIASFPWPVIAGVLGACFGGGMELALCCDIRIASQSARFGLPEVNLGIIPGWGGTQRLPRLIGAARARDMIFTGRIITADEALRIGLVNRVVPDEELENTCIELAKTILDKAPLAIKMAKQAIDEGLAMSFEEGLKLEEECFAKLCSSEDMKEGTLAFIEKRKPQFTGK